LAEAYAVERELGGGGMSRVFLAEERALGRQVVVKVLAPELAEGLSADRFAREVRVVARLQQANIVPLIHAGVVDGLPYYTMPFVPGESLRARLASGSLMPATEAIGLLRDVLKALVHAHSHGVVHRDIKPDNVLLSGGTAVVTDFGVAKAVGVARTRTGSGADLTRIGVSIGTPAYMAPEQALGSDVDHRADLYAWGVLAYELLSGRHPFAGRNSAQQLMAAHVTEPPPALSPVHTDVSAELVELVMRALEKNPDQRPQSADEVLRALDAVTSPTKGTQSLDRARARPSRAALTRAAVPVLVLLALGLGASALWRRGSSAPVDEHLVAVAPFRVSGADASLGYLREGMVDLLVTKLGGVGETRSIDPRTILSAWRRAAGSVNNELAQDEAIRLAAGIGAGRLVLGEIVGTASRVTLTARLLSTRDGTRQSADATVEGAADSLPALIDQLAGQLLSLSAGESHQSLSSLTSASLPALSAYLDGQAALRRGEFAQAVASLTHAVELDSTFALAGLHLVHASAWSGPTGAARQRGAVLGRAAAWRGRSRLSPRDRALLQVRLGPRYPAPRSSAERIAAAERYATMAPDSPEALYELADAYFHDGPNAGTEDSDARALRAFERSLALDSAYLLSLQHLPVVHRRLGDTTGVRLSTALLLARNPGSDQADFVRWYAAAAVRDSAASRAMRDQFATFSSATLRLLQQYAVSEGIALGDVELALRAGRERALTAEQRAVEARVASSVASEMGQPSQVARILGRDVTSNPASASRLLLEAVFGAVDSALAAQAARTLATWFEDFSPRDDLLSAGPLPFWSYAQYRLALGDMAPARRVISMFRAWQPPVDSQWVAEFPRRFAQVLEAQVAVLDGHTDRERVVAQLDSALRMNGGNNLSTYIGNLVVARLWEELGAYEKALAAARRRPFGLTMVPFTARAVHTEARMATLVGDVEGAIRAYRHFLALRERAEEPLQREVAQARAELARLERLSAGR
jgi:serine/threonine-protein kinase